MGAIGAALFGIENRWGKLPITMYPHSYISDQDMANYDMSRPPGRTYKYFNAAPLFPFGFGLSLTSFSHVCWSAPAWWRPVDRALKCNVKNIGNISGDEVLQVYHRAQDIGPVSHPVP